MVNRDEIARRFTYSPPSPDRVQVHEHLREQFSDLAQIVADLSPGGREQSLAITHLETALFWANSAVARPPQSPQGETYA